MHTIEEREIRGVLERFVVVEGLDGNGKSTVLPRIASELRKHRKRVRISVSAEPTDGHIGRTIRSILHNTSPIPVNALPLLYAADRYYHLFDKKTGVVRRVRRENCWELCSRYIYSSFAYQRFVAEDAFIQRLNRDFPLPQFLFYIDLKPELSLERLSTRAKRDMFEQIAPLRAVYRRYQTIIAEAQKSDTIVHIIDGERSSDNIVQIIVDHLLPHIDEYVDNK